MDPKVEIDYTDSLDRFAHIESEIAAEQDKIQENYIKRQTARLNQLSELKKTLLAEGEEDQRARDVAMAEFEVTLIQDQTNKQTAIKKAASEAFFKNTVQKQLEAEEAAKGRKLTNKERKAIIQKFQYTEDIAKKYEAREAKRQKIKDDKQKLQAERQKREEYNAEIKGLQSDLLGKGKTPEERLMALKSLTHSIDDNGDEVLDMKKAFSSSVKILSNLSQQLDGKIEEIARNKAAVDTRLQGSTSNTAFGLGIGSQWDHISKLMVRWGGLSPYMKQENLAAKVKEFVNKGISFNVTQRAYLDTIKDKIATTFNAADGTLLRLVRIQQQDTTAGRLGMESALNSFLNRMYETTEYMEGVASQVKTSIEESMALMSARDSVAFEYQVQKWMGSLYSVGMSSNAVQGIAGALGKLAAGDITGITGGNTGNLMVMAANRAGLSIADILAKGLSESSANKLLQSMVNYLADIYNQSKDSLVVQQQMANVYGVAASDLKAAVNLASNKSTMKSITGSSSNYTESILRLLTMANTMSLRTSMGEMLTNMWDNVQYSMASGIASRPALYGLYKSAGLLEDMTGGGIAIPAISVMGNMVDLHTSVADLMRAGALGGSALGAVGQMIAGLGSGGGLNIGATLANMGALTLDTNNVKRGNVWSNGRLAKASVSESGYLGNNMVGNTDGGDVQAATMAQASDETDKQMQDAQDEDEQVTTKTIDEHIIELYTLFQDVIEGTSALTVKLTGDNVWGGLIPGSGNNTW